MKSIDHLSEAELFELRADVRKMLATKRVELTAKLEALEQALGVSSVGSRKRGVKKGTKIEPKYRGPAGELWSGRGLRPKWFAQALRKGRKAEEFLIA